MTAGADARLRVLHVCEALEGGMGRYVAQLVGVQVSQGWEVAVAAPAGGAWVPAVRDAGGRHHAWAARAQPGPWVAREVVALRGLVRAARPDLVHLHSSKAGLAGRLAVRGRVPTVHQPHAWSFYAVDGALRRAAAAWERAGARWTDLVLCVSRDEAQAASAHRIHARVEVVANGVDLRVHAPADGERQARARRALGLAAPPAPLAVCVGRLHRQKGQARLLAAWPQVRAQVPAAELALVGDGPDARRLAAAAGPGVRLVGASGQVADWFAAADVVAAPSSWEGMSLSLLEAMATARSVVVTDVPGMAEVVLPGTGAVVPRDDVPALAAAVAHRLRDPALAAAEGAAGRRLVEQRHDLARHLDTVLALSREVVRCAPSG